MSRPASGLAADPWPGQVVGRPGSRPVPTRLLLVGTDPVHPGPVAATDRRAAPRRHAAGYGHSTARDAPPEVLDLPVERWHGPVDSAEAAVLERAADPVLDVGCGPGRHVQALAGAGRPALGIDVSAAAVAATRARGGRAVRASVFGPVPGAGRWGSVLLFDGNIGIGGDPVALLRRIRELLRPAGTVLAEVEAPGVPSGRYWARVDHAGRVGPRFPWARLGAGRIAVAAGHAGLSVAEIWSDEGRWFAQLVRAGTAS